MNMNDYRRKNPWIIQNLQNAQAHCGRCVSTHGTGDAWIALYRFPDGTEVIRTNGDPIWDDTDGFIALRDAYMPEARRVPARSSTAYHYCRGGAGFILYRRDGTAVWETATMSEMLKYIRANKIKDIEYRQTSIAVFGRHPS